MVETCFQLAAGRALQCHNCTQHFQTNTSCCKWRQIQFTNRVHRTSVHHHLAASHTSDCTGCAITEHAEVAVAVQASREFQSEGMQLAFPWHDLQPSSVPPFLLAKKDPTVTINVVLAPTPCRQAHARVRTE